MPNLESSSSTAGPSTSVRLSEHFTRSELACPCCEICRPAPALIAGLEAAHQILGLPILVTSGCRCPRHNAAVDGRPGSYHLTTPEQEGRAADITVPPLDAMQLYRKLWGKVPMFRGFGVDQERGFLHVDVRLVGPARWTYRQKQVVPWIA